MLLATLLLASALPQQADVLAGYLPKEDLGATRFLEDHPEADGRGIRVAILDTGVDPGHPYLQQTTTGGRKLVGFYDATGDGRLPTDHRAEADRGRLLGLSGRELLIGPHRATDGAYYQGRLDLAEFLPKGLWHRVRGERRSNWEKAKATRHEEGLRSPDLGVENPDPIAQRRAEEEEGDWDRFDNPGPIYDVVVFRDRTGWQVVIDCDEDGDLGNDKALRPFNETGDWATLGDEALLNYGVEIAEDGTWIDILFDGNGHGTHVGGIVAAFAGADHRLNGLAPGAELVGIKIGNSKFGGSTTGFSIAKALEIAGQAGCRIVNISFGGPSFLADGSSPDAIAVAEATRKYGMCVVTSAGNEGPGLSSVGAPGTHSKAFTIAAAVWPTTQRSNYASLDPAGPVLFDFSSRGPLPNGDIGLDFAAPGAAWSSLPSWLLTPGENYNGTSMAAPQASGAIALLLCQADAEALPSLPARVHHALRLSAKPIEGFSWVDYGHGAIHLPGALESLRRLADGPLEQDYSVSIDNPGGNGGGIYERDLQRTAPFERYVRIAPVFDEGADNARKAAFHRTFLVESDASWLQPPETFYTTANGRGFKVRITPGELGPGLHTGRLLLHDADRPDAGPELVIPVAMIRPAATTAANDHRFEDRFAIQPGQLVRRFVRVPSGAHHARLSLLHESAGRNELRTSADTVSGFRYFEQTRKRNRIFLNSRENHEELVPVEPGTVLEYAVASRWSTNRPAEITLAIQFEGLGASSSLVHVPAGQGVGYLGVESQLRDVRCTVSAEVEGRAVPVLADWEIVPDPILDRAFDDWGLFWARVVWPVQVTADRTSVALAMPASLPTSELREDLMLTVKNQHGRPVLRKVVAEIETDLGVLDAGEYSFCLEYSGRGSGAFEARFAGAEVRFRKGGGSVQIYGSLEGAFSTEDGLGQLTIPRSGRRTLALVMPHLSDLDDGAYWFGSVEFESGGDTLLRLPLRIDRPRSRSEAASPDLADDEDPVSAERTAWEEKTAEGDLLAILDAARAWDKDAESAESALAVLDALLALDWSDRAALEGRSFLVRFPDQVAPFLERAKRFTWPEAR